MMAFGETTRSGSVLWGKHWCESQASERIMQDWTSMGALEYFVSKKLLWLFQSIAQRPLNVSSAWLLRDHRLITREFHFSA